MANSRESYGSSAKKTSTRTLGLEKELHGTFSYTMNKISNLGVEVERLKVLNQNLAQKLSSLHHQKDNLVSKNMNLEQEILKKKEENHQFLLQRENAQRELEELKRALSVTNEQWESKKKELDLEIHHLKGAKVETKEEECRDKFAFGNQKVKLTKQIQAKMHNIEETREEIKKHQDLIYSLRKTEQATTDAVNLEALRFKRFLDTLA